MSRRASLKLADERERQFERTSGIVASSLDDYPSMSVLINAALAHPIQSEEYIQDARDKYDPETVQQLCNTSALRLQYRTRIKSRWR